MSYRKPFNFMVIASAIAAGALVSAPVANAQPAPRVVGVFQALFGSGGYTLYSNGKLNAQLGAPFYGDARKSGLNNFTAMAQSLGGYWLINSAGRFFQYGDPCFFGKVTAPKGVTGPIIGAIGFGANDRGQGFQAVNAAGKLFRFGCSFPS